jgi:hypothetical protein
MKATKYLYRVTYKAPLLYRNDWYVDGYVVYAQDEQELQAKIKKLSAHSDPTKEFIEATPMPHGFNGGIWAYYPPTIEVDEEIQQ